MTANIFFLILVVVLLIGIGAVFLFIRRKTEIEMIKKRKQANLQYYEAISKYSNFTANQQREMKEKQQAFLESPSYKFVQSFVKKYDKGASLDHVSKLQHLLMSHKWSFSLIEINNLLIDERDNQQNYEMKTKILAAQPDSIEDYVRSFIDVCGGGAKNLNILIELLQENGMYKNEDTWLLESKIQEIAKQIEIELFELDLFDNKD